MNTLASQLKKTGWGWPTSIALALCLWLGGSLLLDFVVMPSLFVSGMMQEPGFASAGYILFHNCNRIEIILAALVLTGLLAWNYSTEIHILRSKTTLIFAALLILIPALSLYGFTPWMSSLSLPLNLFDGSVAIPTAMLAIQGVYWALESLKLAAIVTLLGVCFRTEPDHNPINAAKECG